MKALFSLGAMFLLFTPATLFAQGSLTPPAGPGPTMKTLQQIEPRVPLANPTTPGDANYEFIISQAGYDGNDFDIGSTANLILKNDASANTPNNYDIAADNRYGEIIDLTAAGSAAAVGNAAAGSAFLGANTWANFAH